MPAQKTSKEAILIAAMQVFRRQGFHHTSIADLAKSCGIQKAHFYYYFPGGKDELMEEVLKAVRQYVRERVLAWAYDESLSMEERMAKMTEKLGKMFFGVHGGCIMGNTALETSGLMLEPGFLDIVREYFHDTVQALSHLYREAMPEDLARERAMQAVQDIQGGIMLMQLFKDESYLRQALARTRGAGLATSPTAA
ncbi:MAG: TetR/AcrR family transcriptional regulator [Bacteroidetes bacterium]|nr:MAG: TetR/AcrR family transcriptional regulator [Bacteroidota bacterium]